MATNQDEGVQASQTLFPGVVASKLNAAFAGQERSDRRLMTKNVA